MTNAALVNHSLQASCSFEICPRKKEDDLVNIEVNKGQPQQSVFVSHDFHQPKAHGPVFRRPKQNGASPLLHENPPLRPGWLLLGGVEGSLGRSTEVVPSI